MSGWDALIVVAYLVLVVIIGTRVGRGESTATEYFLAGRALPWWAILGSIVATETSTATFLSVPGLSYAPEGGNLRFLQLALGYVVGRMVVAALILPLFFRGEMATAYEVLAQRFGNATRAAVSCVFLLARNVADGLRLFLAALALRAASGFSMTTSICLMGGVTIAYTVIGGLRSVVWNDCVQLVIYIAGALAALGLMVIRLPDGWSQVIQHGQATGKFHWLDLSWNLAEPYTFWAGLLGGLVLTMATHGSDQLMVQRYLGARSQREAARALIASGFFVFAQFALFLFVGIALSSYVAQFPPDQSFQSNDEVFSWFIAREMPVGLAGLTLAAVFAAAMSTLSSSLNASASSALNDLLIPLRWSPADPGRGLQSGRILTIFFGLVQIGIALASLQLNPASTVVNDVLAIAGFTSGVILGVFALGMFLPGCGQRGALIGLAAGLLMMSLVRFLTTIAWPWYALIGSTATFAAGWLTSLTLPVGQNSAERK